MARILYVIRPSKGGAFAHVRQLCEAFSERGHALAVCGPHSNRVDEIAATVIPVEMGRPISPAADARAIAAVADAIREFEPDVVHAHGSKGGVMARLARVRHPRTPLILTPHQYAFVNYFAGAGQRLAYQVIERTLAPLATRVIGVCEAERRIAARIGPQGRTRLVYNGITPLPRVPPSERLTDLRERGPVVLAVAELHERKGIATLLEAAPLIRRRHPEAQIAIAGDGPAQAELVALRDELGFEDVVRFLGHVEDVPAALAGADVFVNPAWAEAFPYSVLEAMSTARPIVATDVGGTAEAIRTGETGVLVPPHDAPALAEGIAALLDDRRLAARLGGAAEAEAAERFSLEQMIAGTAAVYEELGIPRSA